MVPSWEGLGGGLYFQRKIARKLKGCHVSGLPQRRRGHALCGEMYLTVAKKYKDITQKVEKKGLPAAPYSTLTWPARRRQEFTVREIYK